MSADDWHTLGLAPGYAPMEAKLADAPCPGRRLAVRAEVGRVSLPRVSRRRCRRAARPSRASRSARYFPEMIDGAARARRRPLRARRRAGDPARRDALVRCPADAAAPGGKPHPQARRARPRRSACCSTAWRRRQMARRTAAGRAARRARGILRRHGRRPRLLLSPCTRDRRARRSAGWPTGRRRARRRRRQAPRRAYAAGRAGDAEGQARRTADCVVGGFRYGTDSRRSARCCSASTTTRACSIMSASPRDLRRRTAPS